ncbi:MAG: signal recognition particle protein [Christensenellales bacterium]|jgi:signal recognition particle subunit SRP54
MAFEGLAEKLQGVFKKLTSRGKINESDVKAAMREVRMALLEADVNYMVVKDFVKKVSERCVGSQVMESLTPGQQVIKIVREEMTALMGGSSARIETASSPPTVIMMAGLQGAGKTTMCGKIGTLLTKQGKSPMLAACDIYRPAAIKQLQIVGEKTGLPVFERGVQAPEKTVAQAIEEAKRLGRDTLIIDTAGRLHIDDELMAELERVKAAAKPNEILLVVDAMTGQDAVNVAKVFDERLGITGVALTKLDGDTRGGAALSIRAVTGKPIKFSGTGEKFGEIELFHPDRMAGRILGMGDVLSLIEKAEQAFDEKKAEELSKKLMSQRFTLDDFLEQFQQIKKMGSLGELAGMMPGMGALKDAEIDERQMLRTEAIIHSMTKEERAYPEIINGSRRKRIAKGSGTQIQDVNRLLGQFSQMQKMVKQLSGKKGRMKIPFGLR